MELLLGNVGATKLLRLSFDPRLFTGKCLICNWPPYLKVIPISTGHLAPDGGVDAPHKLTIPTHQHKKYRKNTTKKSRYNSEHCIYGTALAYNSDSLIVRSHATFRESKALSIKLTFRFLFFLIQNWSELLDKISKPAESLQLPVTTQHAISHVVFVKYFLLP